MAGTTLEVIIKHFKGHSHPFNCHSFYTLSIILCFLFPFIFVAAAVRPHHPFSSLWTAKPLTQARFISGQQIKTD